MHVKLTRIALMSCFVFISDVQGACRRPNPSACHCRAHATTSTAQDVADLAAAIVAAAVDAQPVARCLDLGQEGSSLPVLPGSFRGPIADAAARLRDMPAPPSALQGLQGNQVSAQLCFTQSYNGLWVESLRADDYQLQKIG